MKSKIGSIISSLLTILLIAIIFFLGYIIYQNMTGSKSNLVNQVEEFVSNVVVEPIENAVSKVETPQVLETSSENKGTITKEDEQIDYLSSNIDKYYYKQLNQYSRIIYNAMYQNKENMKSGTFEINLGTEFTDLLSKSNGGDLLGKYYQSAIEAYTYDNPDVFYIEYKKLYLNIETTTIGTSRTYKVFINSGKSKNYLINEFASQSSVNSAISSTEKVKKYFIQNKKSSTYDNIKQVHDYLVESVEYDESLSGNNIYNIYGALVKKRCVCEGYAKAFKYIMDGLDIPCVLVSGIGTNSQGQSENHAWNYVQIGNKWYGIDCTWDDPIIKGGGTLSNSQKYKYFLKGSSEFSSNHRENGKFTQNGMNFTFPKISTNSYK